MRTTAAPVVGEGLDDAPQAGSTRVGESELALLGPNGEDVTAERRIQILSISVADSLHGNLEDVEPGVTE